MSQLLQFGARPNEDPAVHRSHAQRMTVSLMLLTVALLQSGPLSAAPPADLTGSWRLNEEDSDDSRERLQGLTILRSQPRSVVQAQRDREEAGMTRQQQVYDEMQLAKERKLINQEADVGGLGEIIHTASLQLSADATTVTVTYDGGLVRVLAPRPGGARYSAKGDEFVETGIGRSMVYWRGKQLLIETLLAPRGTMIETLSLRKDGRQLEVQTVLRNPDWLVNPEISRVFDRQ